MDRWTIYGFFSNAYIQQTIKIDHNICIYPMPSGLALRNEAEYIDRAVRELLRTDGRWASEEISLKEYEKNNSVVAVQISLNLDTVEPEEAFNLAEQKLTIVTNFLSYYTKNAVNLFGLLLVRKDRFYVKLIHSFPRKIMHLMDDLQKTFKSVVELSEEQPKVRLYFDIYYDALKEIDPDFKFFKLYSLLELMAQPYGVELPLPEGIIPESESGRKPYASEKVKSLFKDLSIGIPKIDSISLIDIASKHRNCVGHFGICAPELNSKCAEWCKGLIGQRQQVLDELIETVNFVIGMSVGKYGR